MSNLIILAHRVEKQTDTQTNEGKDRTPATAVGVGNDSGRGEFRKYPYR